MNLQSRLSFSASQIDTNSWTNENKIEEVKCEPVIELCTDFVLSNRPVRYTKIPVPDDL